MAVTFTTLESADVGPRRFRELTNGIRTPPTMVVMRRPNHVFFWLAGSMLIEIVLLLNKHLRKGFIKELKWVLLFNQFVWL